MPLAMCFQLSLTDGIGVALLSFTDGTEVGLLYHIISLRQLLLFIYIICVSAL